MRIFAPDLPKKKKQNEFWTNKLQNKSVFNKIDWLDAITITISEDEILQSTYIIKDDR